MAEAKKKRQPASQRHPLLLYRRAMDRICATALMLAVLMVALRFLPRFRVAVYMPLAYLTLLSIGTVLALAVVVLALVARRLAFVQARGSYLQIRTPFLSLKISYQRVLAARPSNLSQAIDRSRLGWAQRSFLEPYLGKTAVLLDLKSFPVSPFILRFFLLPVMFQKNNAGLVLVVKDWMALITEIDSMQSNWKYRPRDYQPITRGGGGGLLGSINRK